MAWSPCSSRVAQLRRRRAAAAELAAQRREHLVARAAAVPAHAGASTRSSGARSPLVNAARSTSSVAAFAAPASPVMRDSQPRSSGLRRASIDGPTGPPQCVASAPSPRSQRSRSRRSSPSPRPGPRRTTRAPPFQMTPGHTGFASGGSLDRPPVRPRWTRTVGTATTYPLVAGGRVFVVAYDAPTTGRHAARARRGERRDALVALAAAEGQIAYDDGPRLRRRARRDRARASPPTATGATLWTASCPRPFDAADRPSPPTARSTSTRRGRAGTSTRSTRATGPTHWHSAFYDEGGTRRSTASFVHVADDDEGRRAAFSRADGDPRGTRRRSASSAAGRLGRRRRPRDRTLRRRAAARSSTPRPGWKHVPLQQRGRRSPATSRSCQRRDAAGAQPRHRRDRVGVRRATAARRAAGDRQRDGYAGSSTGCSTPSTWHRRAAVAAARCATGIAAGGAGMAAGGGLLVVPAGGTLSGHGVRCRPPAPGLDLQITGGPDGPTRATARALTFGSSDAAGPAASAAWTAAPGWPCLSDRRRTTALADGPANVRGPDARTRRQHHRARGARLVGRHDGARGEDHERPSGDDDEQLGVVRRRRRRTPSALLECRLDDGAWSTCGRSASGHGRVRQPRRRAASLRRPRPRCARQPAGRRHVTQLDRRCDRTAREHRRRAPGCYGPDCGDVRVLRRRARDRSTARWTARRSRRARRRFA